MTRHDKEMYADIHEKAIRLLEEKGYENIKADFDGYEQPKGYLRKMSNNKIHPDIVAEKNGRKVMFDLSLKTPKAHLLRTKIMFLSRLARMKNYGFKVLTTRGHIGFTKDITENAGLSPTAYMRI